ncbi:MAG TPA: gephyrin-like molybdotransferase Glp [Longimicrobiales bacterium]|nr:gephyrin-like molybdotransferase Glp [Longimicrobiales bacterium]
MRQADWLDIADALRIMLEHVSPLDSEPVALDHAFGRTLAAPVVSPIDQPPWDNSAMDGFAVRSSDVRGATADDPVTLEVIEDIPAGALPLRAVGPGQASRIMTGAPLPAGADGVIRIEHTEPALDARVRVLRDDDAGRNVRFRGEDIRTGDVVLEPGRHLRAGEVGVLAMVGCTTPLVCRRPRVALLATGDELVEPERIADVIAATHIVNSNTPALAAALRATDCEPVLLGIARDELSDLRTRLTRALYADALITTAGASVGDHDLVKTALEEIGCETLFWRVRIRPGSPFSFGLLRRPDGRSVPVFGLPGNPVSALVTFEILVRPVLRRMLGRARVYPVVELVQAGEDIRSPAGLVRFLRVRLGDGPDGIRRAYLTGPQGSGILTSVAAADALLVVPLDVREVPAGATVRIVRLHAGDNAQELFDLT